MADTLALGADSYIPSPDYRGDGGGKGYGNEATRSSLYIPKEWAWIACERGGDSTGKARRCEGDKAGRWSIHEPRGYPRGRAGATLSHREAAGRRRVQAEVEANGGIRLNWVGLHQRVSVQPERRVPNTVWAGAHLLLGSPTVVCSIIVPPEIATAGVAVVP